MKKILKNYLFLPLIIVIAAAFVMIQIKSKQAIDHQNLQFPVKKVEILTLKKIPFRTRAIAYGNVEPATVLKAKSEVNGAYAPKLKSR